MHFSSVKIIINQSNKTLVIEERFSSNIMIYFFAVIHAFSPKQRAFSLKEWASIFRNKPILDRVKHELNSTRSEFWREDKRDYSEKSLEKTLIMRFHYCSLCANDTLLSTSCREYRHGSSLLTCRFALLRSLTAENVRCSHTRHIHIRVLFLSSSRVSFNSRQNCRRVNQKRRNTGIRDILETICIGLDGNLIFEQNP